MAADRRAAAKFVSCFIGDLMLALSVALGCTFLVAALTGSRNATAAAFAIPLGTIYLLQIRHPRLTFSRGGLPFPSDFISVAGMLLLIVAMSLALVERPGWPLLVLGFVVVILGGRRAGPTRIHTAISSPDRSEERASSIEPVAGASDLAVAEIELQREANYFADSFHAYKVIVDGEQRLSIREGQEMRIAVAPGDHELQLRINHCRSPIVTLRIAGGERLRYRCRPNVTAMTELFFTTFGRGRYIHLEPVVPEAGRSQIHGSSSGKSRPE